MTRKLAADLKRLQNQDADDLRKARERNGWWAYLASPIYGTASETDEQKQTRESKRLDRVASRSIKGSELDEKNARLQRLQDALQNVNGSIVVEKKKAVDEEIRGQCEARARKMASDREARDRAGEAQTIGTRPEGIGGPGCSRSSSRMGGTRVCTDGGGGAEPVEIRRRDAEERGGGGPAEERPRDVEERARTIEVVEEAARRAKPATKSTCRHGRFWPKIEGAWRCSNCCAMQRRFAFECPGCKIVACASCRRILRGERRSKKSGVSGRRYGFAGNDDYGDDSLFFDFD